MDPSSKGGSQRPRRPRSVPPPTEENRSLVPLVRLQTEVPRFVGSVAPLAVLAGQVRNARDSVEKASAASRLARGLVRRGIETREAISLAENSLALKPDTELALDLAGWWVEAGDLIRGAALLQTTVEGLVGPKQVDALLEIARLHARSNQVHQAVQALRQAMSVAPDDPRAYEAHGSLGFWAELSHADCARSYLKAAELRARHGEKASAFENLLRAFEVDPTHEDAAVTLSDALGHRGRPGAADEILREHLRRGSAAQRAAHHQRAFYAALTEGDFAQAMESALEADLDLELESERVAHELESPSPHPVDFEGFLVRQARSTDPDVRKAFGGWLLTLIDVSVFDWGAPRMLELRALALARLDLEAPPPLESPEDPTLLRELRKELASSEDEERSRTLRKEIALRECARGAWGDAFEVFEPLLADERPTLRVASLGVIISGRCRQPLSRARALTRLGKAFGGTSGAVAHAVAAEMFIARDKPDEAWAAANAAVQADPGSERAVASQALVALHAPEGATAGQLERSLSVLVARADACILLCQSANERGSERLGLTWAARALALRPGDREMTGAYLSQAISTKDPTKVQEALGVVLGHNGPTAPLAPAIARAVRALHGIEADEAEEIGLKVLAAMGVRATEATDALIELAKDSDCPKLLSAITERQLVDSGSDRASLYLALCRQRLRSGEKAVAARALRRALAQGAERTLVQEALQDFQGDIDPDGQIALLEIEADLVAAEPDEGERAAEHRRAEALRTLGAARWDMAQDTQGAINLWLRAADLDRERGLEYLAHYLHHIAGPEAAAEHLQTAAKQTEDPKRSARLLGLSAYELFEQGHSTRAFEVAKAALERAPLMTELLSIVESCAPEDRLDELLELYELLAVSSMGCYGERAVHYRAARQLEKRGMPERALAHACSAFEAVPAEGVAFVLMARLADSTAGHAALVTSLEKAADAARNDHERARWLAKAGALADTESVGRRQRVDILLRAAQMLPEQETIAALLDSLAHYLADEPDALDELWERFLKVSSDALRHASGAHGAQLCLMFASAGVTHFEQPDYTVECLRHAVRLDREIPEYERLLPFVTQIAGLPEQAGAFLEEVRTLVERDTMLLGRGLATLSGRVAELLGDTETQTELLVRAATDFPEDGELLNQARVRARASGRDDLIKQVEGLLPAADRAASVLRRLDDLTDEQGLDELLAIDLDAAPDDLRARLLENLGTRQEALGRFVDAAASFRELHVLEPENDVALRGIERDADQNGNYEELARVLKLRAALAKDPGSARRLHLRRVAVLETKLGRGNEARELLAEMVETTRDRAALRMLADSWERAGDATEAAELWLAVQSVTADVEEADDAAFRAATCFSESGLPKRAAQALALIKRAKVPHRKLGLELAREIGDPEAIREQLVALARVTVGDNQFVESLYLEAAQLALTAGKLDKAESAARGAKLALPHSSQARLLLARLRLLKGPLSDAAEAKQLLLELDEAEALSTATELEIRDYCRAQAARLTEGDDIARAILEQAIEDQGSRGLLSLGLAELCAADEPERALSLYEDAVGAVLHDLRREGEVLYAAGTLARSMGQLARARAFISAIADDDPMRVKAAKELEEISLEIAKAQREEREKKAADERRERDEREAAERDELQKAAVAAERAAAKQAEAARAAQERAMVDKAADDARKAAQRGAAAKTAEQAQTREQEDESTNETAQRERAEGEAEMKREEQEAANRGRGTSAAGDEEAEKARREAEREAIREAARAEHRQATAAVFEHEEVAPVSRSRRPRAVSGRPGSARPSPAKHSPPSSSHHKMTTAIIGQRLPSAGVPQLGEEIEMEEGRKPMPPSSPPTPAPVSSAGATEDQLVAALEAGDIDSGRQLLERMHADRNRSRDAVVVAQHLVALKPGDVAILELLVNAAHRDGNEALANAVRHVIGSYGGGEPISPPDIEGLEPHGNAALSLAQQGAISPLHEALAVVWEHCHGLYKKDLSAYRISGVERVPLSAPTALGGLYRDASKVLGGSKTAVFRLPGQNDIALQLGLLSPPAVIVAGEIGAVSPELSFHFGAMLVAASPEHALTFGCTPEEVQHLLDALAVSFGPGRASDSRPDPEVTRVAAYLWETIPSRAQRRLSQLCKRSEDLLYEPLAVSAKRVLRRAGLLVCGDLPTAVTDVCYENGMTPPTNLSELAECAATNPAVGDLLGLALSPEYAEVRFRVRT